MLLSWKSLKWISVYCVSFGSNQGAVICAWRPGQCLLCVISFMHCKRQNTEISKKIFPEKEYRGLSPNFLIHASVSDLYIPTMGLPILLEEICGPILGLYKSLTDTWMWKLGLRPRYSQKRNTWVGFSLQCAGILCTFSNESIPAAAAAAGIARNSQLSSSTCAGQGAQEEIAFGTARPSQYKSSLLLKLAVRHDAVFGRFSTASASVVLTIRLYGDFIQREACCMGPYAGAHLMSTPTHLPWTILCQSRPETLCQSRLFALSRTKNLASLHWLGIPVSLSHIHR